MASTTEVPGRAADPTALARAPWGARVLGAVLLVAGLFLLWTAYRSADGGFAAHGPWLAPLVVTAAWVALAAWYLVGQFVGPHRADPPTPVTEDQVAGDATAEETGGGLRAAPVRWLTPALLAAALVGYVSILDPVGFVLASAVFFVAAARILGSHRSLRDAVVAVPLAVAAYVGFTQGLDITLPAGVLPL